MTEPDPIANRQYLEKLVRITEGRLHDENFGVPQLAHAMGISRSNLHRKIKMLTGKSASLFIREQRLKESMELLHRENMTISEVAYKVGFSSVAYFDRCFHEFYGISPGEARKKSSGTGEQPAGITQPDTREDQGLPFPGKNLNTPNTPHRKWIIFIAGGFFLILLFLHIAGRRTNEKSVAVLPFINESPDSTDIYFNNGITSAITDRLANIKDLKVISQNSMELYRNNRTKSTPQIARELGVRYIVEGSGQKSDGNVLITVQLIEARHDRHILSKRYERKFVDIFNLYSEIALDVAGEISALITEEEMEMISNPGSARIEAMRLYVQGDELFNIRHIKPEQGLEYVKQAEAYSRKALRLDSTFSDAWVLLADICLYRDNTDSALLLIRKALHFNKENAKAYVLEGTIHSRLRSPGGVEKAMKTALKYDPENFWAHQMLGGLHYYRGEFAEAIQALLRNREILGSLDPGLSHPELVYREINTLRLARTLFALGFYNEGKKFADEWLALSNDDRMGYNYNLLWAGIINNRFEETYRLGLQDKEQYLFPDYMAMNLMFMDRYDEAWPYIKKSVSLGVTRKPTDEAAVNCLYGLACLKTGKPDEARACFEKSLDIYDRLLPAHPEVAIPDLSYATTDRYWRFPYFILTSIYAVKGEKEKALDYLRLLQKNYHANDLQVVTMLKKWPMFDNIRNDPEFQDYLKKAQSHYLDELTKIRILLEEEGIVQI